MWVSDLDLNVIYYQEKKKEYVSAMILLSVYFLSLMPVWAEEE